jgi:hypothetical protein
MRGELSPLSLGVMAFIVSLCVTPLQYPGYWLGSLGTAAVLVPLAACLVGVVGTLVATHLVATHGGLGRWGPAGRSFALALLVLVLTAGVESLSIYARVDGAVQATHFPIYYAVVFVLAGAVWAAYYGAEGAGRAVTATFPLVAIGLAFIFVSPLGNIDARNLFGPQPTMATGIDVVTWTSLGVIRGYVLVLVWGGRVHDLAATRRAVLWGVVGAGVVAALSVVLAQSVFGLPEVVGLRFPLTAVTGTLFWQWFPTSSMEAVVMVVWQVVTFGTTAVYIALASDLLLAVWRGIDRRLAVAIAVVPFALAGYDLPDAVADAGSVALNAGVLLVGLLVPGVWVLVAAARRLAPLGAPDGAA